MDDPRIASGSIMQQMPACRILWLLVNWNGATLYLFSSIPAGSSGFISYPVNVNFRKPLPSISYRHEGSTRLSFSSGVTCLGTPLAGT
jgi:hypothetical protein